MNKGFTLIELMVTIGIAITITTLVLANFPEFSRRFDLSRTAQQIALSFREAEGAALAVREHEGKFPAYGLHFDLTVMDGDKSYILFADFKDDNPNDGFPDDDNNDGIFDSNGTYDAIDIDIKKFKISGRPRIVNLWCGVGTCSTLDVVFVRPAPDVSIKSSTASYSSAAIEIELQTEKKQIVISLTGQLTIKSL